MTQGAAWVASTARVAASAVPDAAVGAVHPWAASGCPSAASGCPSVARGNDTNTRVVPVARPSPRHPRVRGLPLGSDDRRGDALPPACSSPRARRRGELPGCSWARARPRSSASGVAPLGLSCWCSSQRPSSRHYLAFRNPVPGTYRWGFGRRARSPDRAVVVDRGGAPTVRHRRMRHPASDGRPRPAHRCASQSAGVEAVAHSCAKRLE